MFETPVHILLVEDTPEDVKQFTSIVSGKASISVATTGAEALDRLFRRGKFHAERVPDLVVIDLNVPLLSGHEIVNVIRANSETRHIPVVVYSVSDSPHDINKAYELGACAYMVKPMRLEETHALLNAFAQFWLVHVRYAQVPFSRTARLA